MQGHMIAFQAAMTRTGEMEKSRPVIATSIAAITAALGEVIGGRR